MVCDIILVVWLLFVYERHGANRRTVATFELQRETGEGELVRHLVEVGQCFHNHNFRFGRQQNVMHLLPVAPWRWSVHAEHANFLCSEIARGVLSQ